MLGGVWLSHACACVYGGWGGLGSLGWWEVWYAAEGVSVGVRLQDQDE